MRFATGCPAPRGPHISSTRPDRVQSAARSHAARSYPTTAAQTAATALSSPGPCAARRPQLHHLRCCRVRPLTRRSSCTGRTDFGIFVTLGVLEGHFCRPQSTEVSVARICPPRGRVASSCSLLRSARGRVILHPEPDAVFCVHGTGATYRVLCADGVRCFTDALARGAVGNWPPGP